VIPTHANGRPDVAGCRAEPVRLVPGATYRFAGLANAAGRWVYRPGDYRLLADATHVRTWQEVVVYEGLTGADAGKAYVCPLEDFIRNFELVMADPVPEKELDHRIHGSGV
jgi:hypothetical protein